MTLKTSFNNATIFGISTCYGNIKKNIENDIDLFGGDSEQIKRLKKFIGVNSRYVINENTTSLDLAYSSATKIISEMRVNKKDIDGLIFVTQTPDYRMPGNSHLLQHKLGLSHSCAVFDASLGCSGYIYGLWLAYTMINSGLKLVLLVTGDTFSKVVHKKDRASVPIFGDAVSSTLIGYKEKSISNFILYSDGGGSHAMIQPAGGYKTPSSHTTQTEKVDKDGNVRTLDNFYMSGLDVLNFTLTRQPNLVQEIIEYSNLSISDIDYFVFHQANSYIVKSIASASNIPINKVPHQTFENFGNQSSASIPCTINYELADHLKNNRTNVILQGYGVGLSWGACSLILDNIYCPKPIIYELSDDKQ